MNKIYLSGIVAGSPVQYSKEGTPLRVSFPLCVNHKTKMGIVKRELYTVQAWNGVAEWAHTNLRQGQRVMVQGYLTQRSATSAEGRGLVCIEVTAEEFFTTGVPRTRLANAPLLSAQAEPRVVNTIDTMQ